MAKCFQTWTVLPHDPVQKIAENLWMVNGTMPGGKIQRTMTVAKGTSDRLTIHNGIALDDAEMAELEAFGEPAVLVVPNGFHRQDARIYKDRYPRIQVVCPAAARKSVGRVVAVDGDYQSVADDPTVSLVHLEGCKKREGYMLVRSSQGATLVFNDILLNMPRLTGIPAWFMNPTGRLSVPRFSRWLLVSHRAAFRRDLERLADTPGLTRLILGHGRPVEEQPREQLLSVAREMA